MLFRSDRMVQVGQWQRGGPHYEQALEVVRSGDLGNIRLVKVWAYQGWMKPVPVEPDSEAQEEPIALYMDLWHGKCRRAEIIEGGQGEMPAAKYPLRARRDDFLSVLKGELDPMQAMLTRRLKVDGNMAYFLRNVPTVLDFVRCCRQVEIEDES